jgi:hypothetical protein
MLQRAGWMLFRQFLIINLLKKYVVSCCQFVIEELLTISLLYSFSRPTGLRNGLKVRETVPLVRLSGMSLGSLAFHYGMWHAIRLPDMS